MNSTWGKFSYAALFCIVVPLLLAVWTHALGAKPLDLPRVHSPAVGTVLALAGIGLIARAMWELWRVGGGLPMNAYPPPRFVQTGTYRWLPHPIYTGFGVLVAGVMIATGSAAGLWIVTPVVVLAMTAIVLGYERPDLMRRFGAARGAGWIALPPNSVAAPSATERVAVTVGAFAPWLLAYQACAAFPPGESAIDTMLPFERTWPVWEWTAIFYLGAYAWTLLAPWHAATRAALRQFAFTAWTGTAFIVWCFVVCPFVAIPREVEPTFWGRLLLVDRALDTSACAFPSFHVFWALVAAELWAVRIGRAIAFAIAALISASCVATGVHSILDVLAGAAVWLAATKRERVWGFVRRQTERIANSWRDWRVGPVRIINHGAYVAAATVLGLWCVGLLAGAAHRPALLLIALSSIAGAGLWGQWVEASSQLSRPFGYFGGLFGGMAGTLIAQIVWGDGWVMAGAFAVAAPIIQAVGRLRCLVQGCCHGRPVTAEWLGIRYTQPLSRVCKIAGLGGTPVYPTPLFSLVTNLALFGLLLRLWFGGADLALITGLYLILSTCARFIEEAYRGEPQTARVAGLPIYQWLAMGCLLAGIAVSSLGAPPSPTWSGWSFAPLRDAVPLGLLVWFCMGVDFPQSTRRMSRLA